MQPEFTDKNPKLFYDPAQFQFLEPLVAGFDVIKSELLALVQKQREDQWLRTFPSYVQSSHYKGWKVFSFIFFGMKFPVHASLCPKTAHIIYSIPEIVSCDYSYLKSNTHIKPHKGYTRMVLRCHLPLVVPGGNTCAIRVGDQTREWKEGELMIFDDSFEHEAWNNAGEDRVVLMFDIPNPLWGYSAEQISRYKIEHMDDPFLLSMATKDRWLAAYNEGVFPIEQFID